MIRFANIAGMFCRTIIFVIFYNIYGPDMLVSLGASLSFAITDYEMGKRSLLDYALLSGSCIDTPQTV